MKCLSVRKPWAELIVQGKKDIENRSRRTSYRGRVLIHESKFDGGRGAVIGSVEIVDCVTEHGSPYFIGPVGWVLRDPRKIKNPILCRGQLNLFEVSFSPEY